MLVAETERKLARAERAITDLAEAKVECDELRVAQRVWEQAAADAVAGRERIRFAVSKLRMHTKHAENCPEIYAQYSRGVLVGSWEHMEMLRRGPTPSACTCGLDDAWKAIANA